MAENVSPETDGAGPFHSVVGRDWILIEDLVVETQIGLLASEKGRTQRVRFDIRIRTVEGYRERVAKTGDIVSYADTVEYILQKAASGDHVDLVEEWAEAVAGFVLRNPLADQVWVKVTKPDIFAAAGGVGIEIARER